MPVNRMTVTTTGASGLVSSPCGTIEFTHTKRGTAQIIDQAIEQLPAIVNSREFTAQMTHFVDAATVSKQLAVGSYLGYPATSVGGLFAEMKTAPEALPQAEFNALHKTS